MNYCVKNVEFKLGNWRIKGSNGNCCFYFSPSFLVQNRSKRVRAFSRTSDAIVRLDDGDEEPGDETAAVPFGDEGASSTL